MKKYLFITIGLLCLVALIAQKTLNVYKKDLSVINLATSSIQSVRVNSDKSSLVISQNEVAPVEVAINLVDSMTITDGTSAAPVVQTTEASAISYTTAQVGFSLKNVGSTTITEKGLCWGVNPNPTTDNNKLVINENTIVATLSSLTHATKYYVRSYAINEQDTTYGNEINFSTLTSSLPSIESVSAVFNYSTGKATCIGKITANGGCPIIERGVCWSTSHNPTINNSKYLTPGTSTGQYYGFMSGLNMNLTYYMRAYATNCAGTSYGNEVTVKPMMGNVTYNLAMDQAANPEAYRLIKIAMDSACVYFNRHTTFRANIYVYYSSGIPTAQASYHGSIGFGSNTRYMWVGTAIHEMCHFFGSGTTDIWKSKVVGGVWTGTNGAALLRTLTGETLKGDAMHFWPYGINQKEEITNLGGTAAQETGLANCAKLAKAMLIDDCALPTSW